MQSLLNRNAKRPRAENVSRVVSFFEKLSSKKPEHFKESLLKISPTKKRKINTDTLAPVQAPLSPSHLWKQQVSDLKAKLAVAESRAGALDQATFEKERLDAKVVELQAEVAQMTKDNESLRLNLNANAAVVSQKEAELIEVHAKHQECIKAIDELHQSSQFALAVQKMEQLVEKSDLERQLADKSVELENLRKKLRGSKRSKDIQAIKQDFAALKQSTEEFNRIKTQLTEADVVVQEQASELAVLREQLEDMRVGARLNTAMLRMNKFLEQAQARDWIKTREQITSMKQEIVSISWELRASKREADELRVELETTKAAFEQKVKELAKARSDSFSLQFKIERQQLEINELQKIAAAEHAMNTKLLSFAKKVNAPSKPSIDIDAKSLELIQELQALVDSKDEIIALQKSELAQLKTGMLQSQRSQPRTSVIAATSAVENQENEPAKVNLAPSPVKSSTSPLKPTQTKTTPTSQQPASLTRKTSALQISKAKKQSVSSPRLSLAPVAPSTSPSLVRKAVERAASVRSFGTNKTAKPALATNIPAK